MINDRTLPSCSIMKSRHVREIEVCVVECKRSPEFELQLATVVDGLP